MNGPAIVMGLVMNTPVAALAAGAVLSAVLLALALIGDRSRGRRRCPGCWYDMSATPGFVCPECGTDARREARLFKSRRRKRFIAASLLPLLAGMACYGVAFFQDPGWVKRLPTPVLIVLSAWLDQTSRMNAELGQRVGRAESAGMPEWHRALAGRVSRYAVRAGDEPRNVFYHLWVLSSLKEFDASTKPALVALVALAEHSDPVVVAQAAAYLEHLALVDPGSAADVEEVLTKLARHADRRVQRAVVDALLGVKGRSPGGRAPAMVLGVAKDTTDNAQRARACGLLGLYDSSAESREALLAGAASTHVWVRTRSVSSLTRHAPDDDRVRELLVRALRDPALIDGENDARRELVRQVLSADRWFVDGRGEMSAARRALYSDDVRAAILELEAQAPTGATEWEGARKLLKTHPCFTPEERGRVRGPGAEGSAARGSDR